MDRIYKLQITALKLQKQIHALCKETRARGGMSKQEAVILTALLNQQQLTHGLIESERNRVYQ